VTRILRLEVPPGSLPKPPGTVRLLAVSDDPDPALDNATNRAALGRIDLVVGCGDLEPDRLAFVADAFRADCMFVRGNHDGGLGWDAAKGVLPLEARSGRPIRRAGLELLPLAWPGRSRQRARPDEATAWRDSVSGWARTRLGREIRSEPLVVVSHAPPLGFGDDDDPYHCGFAAYRWLLRRAHPVLWLHGHTPLAAVPWQCAWERTTLVNVTGSVLVELVAAGSPAAT
jgi:uncharacterized protein